MRINKKLVPIVAGLALFCPLVLSHHANIHADITPFEYEEQMRNDDENLYNQMRFQDYTDRANEQAQERYDNETPTQRKIWRKINEEDEAKSEAAENKEEQEQSIGDSIESAQDSEDNKENQGLWSQYIQDGGNVSTTQSPNTNTSIREEAYTPSDDISSDYVHYYSDGSIDNISEPYWPDDSRAVIPSNAKLNTLNYGINNQQTTWSNDDDTNDILFYIGDGLWANENDMLSLRQNYDLDIPATDDGFSHTVNGSQLPGQITLPEDTPDANAGVTPYETSMMDKADGVNYVPTNTSLPTSMVLSMSPASSSYVQPTSVSTSTNSSEDDQDEDVTSDNSSNDDDDLSDDSSESEPDEELTDDSVKPHKHHANKRLKKHYKKYNKKLINRKATKNTNIKKQITLNKNIIKRDQKYLSTRRAKRLIKRYNFAVKFMNHHKRNKHAKRLMKKVMLIKGIKHYLYYYKDEAKREHELTRLPKRINKKHAHKIHSHKHMKRSNKFARHHYRRSHKRNRK